MRIAVTPKLSTKDGESNKNARMTNALVEKNPTGAIFGAVRPGIVVSATSSGDGNGVAEFNGILIAVYGSTLVINDGGFATIGALDNQFFDFTQSTI
jgi:hypothetical protein